MLKFNKYYNFLLLVLHCCLQLTLFVNAGLGFHIKGGVDEPDHNVITISTISEYGSAAADGHLKLGDSIVAVSTIPCFNK